MSASVATPARTRPSGWPARSESRVALTGTIGGLAERLGAPVDFIRSLVFLAAWAQPWTFAAYAVAALALAAPGERRPGLGSLIVAGRLAALMGLIYVTSALPGSSLGFDLEGEPSSWIPFSAIGVAAFTALLVRRRSGSPRPRARDAVFAAAPFVLAAAGITLAVVLLPDVRWESWLFIPAVIAGAALLARPGGRLARAAIAPAVILASLSVLVIGAGVRLQGGVGDTTLRPRSAEELPREYRRAVGDVDLDLTHLREGPRQITLDASVGVGTLNVTVPTGTLVEVDVRVGQGRLDAAALGQGELPVDDAADERNVRILGRGVPVDNRGRRVPPRMRMRLRLSAGIGEVSLSDETMSRRWKLWQAS